MMPTVRDVVSPFAFDAMQVFGYLVFAAAIAVLACAFMRATIEVRSAIARFIESRRPSSPKVAIPPGRVIAFPQKKTRNRLVIQ